VWVNLIMAEALYRAQRQVSRERAIIEGGYYYAWDPRATTALVEPPLVTTTPMCIEIRRRTESQTPPSL
jgi:hypothetical protein